MKSIICIPDRFIVYCSHQYSNGYWLRDEVYDWLRGEVGMGSQGGTTLPHDVWAWLFCPDQHGQPVNNMLRFDRHTDAMKFTLIWL